MTDYLTPTVNVLFGFLVFFSWLLYTILDRELATAWSALRSGKRLVIRRRPRQAPAQALVQDTTMTLAGTLEAIMYTYMDSYIRIYLNSTPERMAVDQSLQESIGFMILWRVSDHLRATGETDARDWINDHMLENLELKPELITLATDIAQYGLLNNQDDSELPL